MTFKIIPVTSRAQKLLQEWVRIFPSTVPYRFPLQIYHARGLLARGVPYFLPELHRFLAKQVKSANRTVFKIRTVLLYWLIYFKSANRFAIILNLSQF